MIIVWSCLRYRIDNSNMSGRPLRGGGVGDSGCQENPYPYPLPLPEMKKTLPLLRKPLPQRLESNFHVFKLFFLVFFSDNTVLCYYYCFV